MMSFFKSYLNIKKMLNAIITVIIALLLLRNCYIDVHLVRIERNNPHVNKHSTIISLKKSV